jgi:hypothetical protein
MANDKREAAAIPPKKGAEKENGMSTPKLNREREQYNYEHSGASTTLLSKICFSKYCAV